MDIIKVEQGERRFCKIRSNSQNAHFGFVMHKQSTFKKLSSQYHCVSNDFKQFRQNMLFKMSKFVQKSLAHTLSKKQSDIFCT